jgi:PleD family two-component response regulator
MSDPKADSARRSRPAASILIASDAQANATMVCELLSQEFNGVRASWIPEAAVAEFDASPPQVLVVAFEELQNAELYYLSLFRLSQTIRRQPHRTIVLCHKDDVRRAFELCRSGHFDDYILFWPMSYDGYRLPMAVYNALRHLAAAQGALKDLREVVDDGKVADLQHRVDERSADAAQAVDALEAPPLRRVLVVEDDPFQRKVLDKYLGAEGYEVMLAADSSEAFAMAMANPPELILMDIMLPNVDGVEATRRMRAHPDLAKIPIVMLTGKSGRETVVESRRAGATDFLVKPVDRKVLIAKVREMLGVTVPRAS